MALLQKIFLAFDQDDAQEFARLLMRIGTDQITSADARDELDVVLEKERAAHKGLGFVLLPLLARSPDPIEKLETLKKTARLLHQFREVLIASTPICSTMRSIRMLNR